MMSIQYKFEAIDIINALQAIMQQNTAFYREDFEIDKHIMSTVTDETTFIWLCRPFGTYCFPESEVFLRGTSPHHILNHYGEYSPNERLLTYAIELTTREADNIIGNLYELDFHRYYQHVKAKTQDVDTIRVIYEYGTRDYPAETRINNPDKVYGAFLEKKFLPNNPRALRQLLSDEEANRHLLPAGNFAEHLAKLHDKLLIHEAKCLIETMQLTNCGHDRDHYTVEISQTFLAITDEQDLDTLCALLPYKSLRLTNKGDGYQTRRYIHIDKQEVHQLRKQALVDGGLKRLVAFPVNKMKAIKRAAKKQRNRHTGDMSMER